MLQLLGPFLFQYDRFERIERLIEHWFKSNLKIFVATQIVVIPVVGHSNSSGMPQLFSF